MQKKYLHKCLKSLLSQTLHNIEIICVDDASTDSSLSILNAYAKKDERIKVVHLSQNVGIAKHEMLDYVFLLDNILHLLIATTGCRKMLAKRFLMSQALSITRYGTFPRKKRLWR